MAKKNQDQSTKKEDFSALLKTLGNKQVVVPTQKVVPIGNNDSKKKADTHKLSLRMYIHEFENLLRFVNYMIIDKKNISYNMSSAISTGIHLLTDTNLISKGMTKVKLAAGRKDQTTGEAIKATTVIIPLQDMNLLNDYIYYKMMIERNTKYSRVDLMGDIIGAIKREYPDAF